MATKKQIADALAHYRCPSCGTVNPGLRTYELQVVQYRYHPKPNRWDIGDLESFCEDNVSEDFTTIPACCGHCDAQITFPDATTVTVGSPDNFHDWLDDLATRWAAQQTERATLLLELEAAYATLNPVGKIHSLQERINSLDWIS